jgi:dGTPase
LKDIQLAYLVEAADDICYTVIDFEDGINRSSFGGFCLRVSNKIGKDNIGTSKNTKH